MGEGPTSWLEARVEWIREVVADGCGLVTVGDDAVGATHGGGRRRGVGEQGAQQQERALFGERIIAGATLGRLDA